MRRFDVQTAVSAVELKQMVTDFWIEIDGNGGRDLTAFFTEDCVASLGPISFKGHEGVKDYYNSRLERIATQQRGGIRTSRHCVINVRIELEKANRAQLNYLLLTFAGSGAPPLLGATRPVSISDVRFLCRRRDDGRWLVYDFHGDLIMMGSDTFVKNSLTPMSS